MNVQIDHVHMVVSIPPRLAVSDFMGVLKGKTAIRVFKKLSQSEEETLLGESFLGKRLLCEYRWHQ